VGFSSRLEASKLIYLFVEEGGPTLLHGETVKGTEGLAGWELYAVEALLSLLSVCVRIYLLPSLCVAVLYRYGGCSGTGNHSHSPTANRKDEPTRLLQKGGSQIIALSIGHTALSLSF